MLQSLQCLCKLTVKVPFFAAICTSSVLGAIIGANKVLGSVGVGGVPAFISIHSEFWFIYIPVTLLAMVIPAILTIIFARFTTIKAKMVATPEETVAKY